MNKIVFSIMTFVLLLSLCSCININNAPNSQADFYGKWYSTSYNMNGQWKSMDIYDNGTSQNGYNPDKLPVMLRLEYPEFSNTMPFCKWTWCYDFQRNGRLIISDGVDADDNLPFSYSNGTLTWETTEDVIVTKDLLIFKRDYGYWILTRQGQVGREPLTYEQGIQSWRKEMTDYKYDGIMGDKIILPLNKVGDTMMLSNGF